jgi:lipopolysaccharide biosynthesis glycosyltransferase
MQQMHIVYSSDDNYAQHMGASIYSLLCHNTDSEIVIHVIDNGISPDSKEKLQLIVKQFPLSQLQWIDFSKWSEKLILNMQWPISLSAYGRLFIGSMLPESVTRCLYLDCDMIICGKLSPLFNMEMRGNTVAAIQDTVNPSTKEAIGLNRKEPYFNSGFLLIDLNKWRNTNAEQACLDFITQHHGRVTHHDQGVLNGIFHQDVSILPLKYNVMTIHYMMERSRILSYFHEESPFYDEDEIAQAKAHPTVLHYTPSFTSRPWVRNCCHPLKKLYWDAVEKTPWAGAQPIKDNSKWYVKLINWRYRKLPF